MARNKANPDKKPPADLATAPAAESLEADNSEITADSYLKLMMRIGIPLALISVLSLWASRSLGSSGIGLLFFITAALTLVIGFAYNIRYVMLLVRQRRHPQPPQSKP